MKIDAGGIIGIAALGIAALWVVNQERERTKVGSAANPVPEGTSYVNPILCALTGKFCYPEETVVVPSETPETDTTPTSVYLTGKLNRGECFTDGERSWAAQYDPTLVYLESVMVPGCV